jgi:TP901 family phage tail tape measure protein
MAEQNILVRVGADISNLTSNLNRASSQVAQFVRNTEAGFQALGAVGRTVAAMGAVTAAGLGGAVKSAADFDTAIRKAGAIAGASAQEFEAMKAAAIDLGANTSKSAKEVANAMTELAAKGFDANQVIAAMPGIIKAAEASGEDLALVSDTVTSALNAFRMEASEANKVADIMAMTANKSAAGIWDMQYAFKYAAPVASQLGISIEELASATGIMADAGIKGEQAGTTLRAALLRLVDPPREASNQLKALGVNVKDQNDNFKSLQQIIGELGQSMEGMTETQKAAALSTIFGTEALSGMMVLLNAGPDAIGEFTTALENSEGAAAKTAKQMKEGIGGAWERMKGSIESAAISIGYVLVPAVTKLANGIAKLVNWFNGLSDGTKKYLVYGAALSAGLAVMLGFILIILGAIPGWIAGFQAIAGLLGVTAGALFKTIAIISGVVGAIILLVSILVIAYNECEWFRNVVNKSWEWIKNATKSMVDSVVAGFGIFVAWLKQTASTISSNFLPTLQSLWDKTKEIFGKFASFVAPILENVTGKVKGFGTELKDAFTKALNLDFSGIANVIAKFIPSIIGLLLGGIPRLIIVGTNMISAIANGMGLTVPQLMDKIVGFITNMINTFVAALPQFLDMGIQLIVGILDGILSQIPTFIDIITQLITTLTDTLTVMIPQLTDAGIQILTALINGIVTALPQILTAGIQVITALIEAIVAMLPTIITAGIGILIALINGIIQSLPQIIDAGITVITALIEGIISVLPALIDAAILLITSVADMLIQNLPVIIEAGIKILLALIDGIMKILPQLINAAIKLIIAIFNALIANLPKIIDAGVKLVMALINGLIKVLPQLVSAAIKLALMLIQTLIRHAPQILQAGVQLIKALVRGLISMLGQVVSSAVKIGKGIFDNIKKVNLLQVGKDIISGLARGISSMASSVMNKAREIASGITRTIKSALKIKSPSRVMKQLGEYTGEGFAIGLNSMIDATKKAANELADSAMPSLQYDVPSVGAMATQLLGRVEVAQPQQANSRPIVITNVWEVDGYELARVTEPYLDARQAQNFTIRSYMNGNRG